MSTLYPAAVPAQVRKRDGSNEPFDPAKIRDALARASESLQEIPPAMLDLLVQAVEVTLASFDHLDASQVQEAVEQQLMEAGYFRTAHAWIVWHERRLFRAVAARSGVQIAF